MRISRSISLLIAAIALLTAAGCAGELLPQRFVSVVSVPSAEETARAKRFLPFDDPETPRTSASSSIGTGTSVFDAHYALWHSGITHVDGPRCPHFPTCSHFAIASLRRHGVKGLYFTTSRLFAEFGDLDAYGFYQLQVRDGVGRIYDPIENYLTLEPERRDRPLP